MRRAATSTLEPDSLLFTLTRWDRESLDAWLAHYGVATGDLGDVHTLERIHDAQEWARQLGVPAAALIAATTNVPDADTVEALQGALRARYGDAEWLDVLQPINDEMRALRRDALVAYILHQFGEQPDTAHIDSSEKLFEFFLMDVGMEPCTLTSRVRHALSSVQLFIERALLNLEPRVASSTINGAQWEWMRRYRVWEANRKVFLWPENWLEPELRDDQSPFFREVMGELLQGDVTEDRAAIALLNYLGRLEEVAKLEPCSIYYAEYDPSKANDDVAHVVARTPGANRKYYYRRREYGYWTPWEEIKLDIEDNPVVPVVWSGRLFVFWAQVLKEAPLDHAEFDTSSSSTGAVAGLTMSAIKADGKANAGANARVSIQAVLCWSEYFNGKWQPTKTSDVNRPTTLRPNKFPAGGAGAFDRSQLSLWMTEDSEGLWLQIAGQAKGSTFLLYNTHGAPVRGEEAGLPTLPYGDPMRSVNMSSAHNLFINYWSYDGAWHVMTRDVLESGIDARIVVPHHKLADNWNGPFFFEDARHVFYVTSSEQLVLIPQWERFDLGAVTDEFQWKIPDLIVGYGPDEVIAEPRPDPLGPLFVGRNYGTIDPSPIEHFVLEDAYIHQGLRTTSTVRFGEAEIGPTGGLGALSRGR